MTKTLLTSHIIQTNNLPANDVATSRAIDLLRTFSQDFRPHRTVDTALVQVSKDFLTASDKGCSCPV